MANDQRSQESLHREWCSPEECQVPVGYPDPARRDGQLATNLVRMVEGEMVPRLLLMRVPEQRGRRPTGASPFTSEHVAELTRLLMTHESSVASAYVEMFRENGATTQEICLHLLSGAARRLGELWEDDRCGFAQVTMGVCSLHQVLHWMTADEAPTAPPLGGDGVGSDVLLSCMPGEQHTFGVLVVAQFLRRDGWSVRNQFPANSEELLQSVRKKSFTIVGLSIGRHSRCRDLTVLIKALRRDSVNREVAVVVGGPVLAQFPQIGRQAGADATMLDAQEAVQWAQGHRKSLAARS